MQVDRARCLRVQDDVLNTGIEGPGNPLQHILRARLLNEGGKKGINLEAKTDGIEAKAPRIIKFEAIIAGRASGSLEDTSLAVVVALGAGAGKPGCL